MKPLLAKFLDHWRRLDIPLPVLAVFGATIVFLPASQLAVLGLLRTTQHSTGQRSAVMQISATQDQASPEPALEPEAESSPITSDSDIEMDRLDAMAASLKREKRAVERLVPRQRSPLEARSIAAAPIPAQHHPEDTGTGVAPASQSVPLDAGPISDKVAPGARDNDRLDIAPSSVPFPRLPQEWPRAESPVFALGSGSNDGSVWMRHYFEIKRKAPKLRQASR